MHLQSERVEGQLTPQQLPDLPGCVARHLFGLLLSLEQDLIVSFRLGKQFPSVPDHSSPPIIWLPIRVKRLIFLKKPFVKTPKSDPPRATDEYIMNADVIEENQFLCKQNRGPWPPISLI